IIFTCNSISQSSPSGAVSKVFRSLDEIFRREKLTIPFPPLPSPLTNSEVACPNKAEKNLCLN
ncbi:hypothetical protein CEXT_281851, partial [Caerostris extrusa]